MTNLTQRIREFLEALANRLRESPRGTAVALVAALGLGLLVGRGLAPSPARTPEPAAAAPATVAKPTDFESLVGGDSPFETSRQGEQKRLVALQNTLGAAIADFDGVERAQVFIAPRPSAVGLGAAAASRTASVHLTMDAGRRLEDGQVEAIARLVAGAETGLRPESVAIVDGSGPRATTATAFDALAFERLAGERLATLLPEGTRPELSVVSRPDGDLTRLDVSIAIPHTYFLAAHALSGDEPGTLAGFRTAEAERLAAAARRSIEAAVDPAAVQIAACRVEWTFVAPPATAAGAVASFPWLRTTLLGTLGVAVAAVIVVGLRRSRRAPSPVVEPKPAAAEPAGIAFRDPAEAAEAIERWVRGGAA